MTKTHKTTVYLVRRATPNQGYPNALMIDDEEELDSEWEDTDALFSPGVLSFFPGLPPYVGAETYSVGCGQLIACDGSGRQLAVWNADHWLKT